MSGPRKPAPRMSNGPAIKITEYPGKWPDSLMKKTKADAPDYLRPEYKRSDFGVMVRGKYASRLKEESNVVLLEPDVAKAFPNDEAVNKSFTKSSSY